MKHLDILLVDDDQNDCALFGIAIGKTDLDICLQIVTGGEQAIDYLEGHGVYVNRSFHPMPALVLLDLDLRLTGGLELLDWRRASASFLSLPVVIFSEFAYKGTIETALAMGASTFIAKPFEFEGWKTVVRQIWELGMKWSQPPKPASAPTPGQGKPSNSILVVDDDIDSQQCTCCGERISKNGNGLSRDSTTCASCSSLLDGMEARDQLELPEQVGNIRRSKPKGNTGTQPGVAMG
jgi:CheY-like chemotaxis protein